MELTDAQKKTIEYFGLEVVETARYEPNQWCVNEVGHIWSTGTYRGNLYLSVVVRPALAARVKELEHELNNAREHMMDMYAEACPGWATDGRAICMIENAKRYREDLELKIAALESELAPIRALKVGSWEWAMFHLLSGRSVVDCGGRVVSSPRDVYIQRTPFTLHTEPPPAPTADELCAAIEDANKAHEPDQFNPRWRQIVMMAAAYRAANAKGGA